MLLYYVRFLRNIVANGHEFCALKRVIPVGYCDDPEDAVRIAQHRFASLEQVSDWRQRADFFEVSVAEPTPVGSRAA
jgi:hypothetical protein